MFWECGECGDQVMVDRQPAVCRECGLAGVTFVRLPPLAMSAEADSWTDAWFRMGFDYQPKLAS